MTETLTAGGREQVFSIAAFFRLSGDLIRSAKIYRERSAEIT